jgi:hypothetical protein
LVLLGANQTTIALTTLSGWFEGMLLDFEPGGMHALLGIDLQQLAGKVLTAKDYNDEGLLQLDRIFCQTLKAENIAPLIDVNDIHISNEREKLGRGWDSVLDSVEKLPSNALLLTDRYLFAFRHPNAGDGLANIKDILSQLLPQQFSGGDYHVTVIFDNMAKHSTYTFDEIATKLNHIKTQLGRDYPIMMEVLGITPDCSIYNKLHSRLIISNYYLVEAGHKLAAFNHDKGTARQTLLPLALFTESSLNGTSTPPLKAIEQTTSTLRNFSKSLPQLTDHTTYLYAVNGQRMEKCISMRNRLIK